MSEHVSYPDPGKPDYCGKCGHKMEIRDRGGRKRPVCPNCGWVYYARPAMGAAVMIEKENKLLLVRRSHNPYEGWWMLPAGFVEYDEFAEQTALREALEETGLEVMLTGFHGLYYGTDDPRNPAHLAVYRAEPTGGRLKAGDDASEFGFFAATEIPRTIAFHAHRVVISEWMAEKLGRPVDVHELGEPISS